MPIDERILWRKNPPKPPPRKRRGFSPWVVGIGGTILELLFFMAGLRDGGAARFFWFATALGVLGCMAMFTKQGWDRGGLVGAYIELEAPMVQAMEGTPRPTRMRNAVIWLVVLGMVLSVVLFVARGA